MVHLITVLADLAAGFAVASVIGVGWKFVRLMRDNQKLVREFTHRSLHS